MTKQLRAVADLTDEEFEQVHQEQARLWAGLERKAKQTEATNRRIARTRANYEDEQSRLNPQRPQRQTAPRRLPL